MKELELNVTGMHCSGCENRIKNVISKMEDVELVDANHQTGKVKVTFKSNKNENIKSELKSKIEELEDFKVLE